MEETDLLGSRIEESLNSFLVSFLSVSSFPSRRQWRGGTPGEPVAAAAMRQQLHPLLLLVGQRGRTGSTTQCDARRRQSEEAVTASPDVCDVILMRGAAQGLEGRI
ncbi:hypothetical protein PIB30_039797 [Stylosanthes scabra]|uniref:Uncharacterized protein n=1 Tax=Stylosanthes scabra TaxID=79078 RepID=A0ABU6YD89_9FABA|nr:hypothetical protein [Stylosanthes scabra]